MSSDFEIEDEPQQPKKKSFFGGGGSDDDGADMYNFDAGAGMGKRRGVGSGVGASYGSYKSPQATRYGQSIGSDRGIPKGSNPSNIGVASSVSHTQGALDKAESLLAKYGNGGSAPLRKVSQQFDEDAISVGSEDDLEASESFEMSSPFSPRAISEKAVSKNKSVVVKSMGATKFESLGHVKGIDELSQV